MVADAPPERIAALRSTEALPAGVSAAGVADAVLFLLSERSASITGQALTIDAGTVA
jgi:enoyl-[acyl-carrier-protein] reductase (NADH)